MKLNCAVYIFQLSLLIFCMGCLVVLVSAKPISRQARSFQWPSFLFGSSSSTTPAPLSQSQTISPNPQKFPPAFRFHKYNGLRLQPIPINKIPGLKDPNALPETQTRNPYPQDLQNLIDSLKKVGITNIPSLKDASVLLGTNTDKETVNAILELAATEDGLELIKTYLSTSQQQPPAMPEQHAPTLQQNHVQNAILPNPSVSNFAPPNNLHTFAVSQPQYSNFLIPQNLYHNNAPLLLDPRKVPITQSPNSKPALFNAPTSAVNTKPSSSFLGRIGSFFSFGEEPKQEEVKQPGQVMSPNYPKVQANYQFPQPHPQLYSDVVVPAPSFGVVPDLPVYPDPAIYPAPVYQYAVPEEIPPVNVLPYAPFNNYGTPLVNSYGSDLPYGYLDEQVAAASSLEPIVVEAPSSEIKNNINAPSIPQRITPPDFEASGKIFTPNQNNAENHNIG